MRTMIEFGRRNSFSIEALPLKPGIQDGDRAAESTWIAWSLWVNGINLTEHTRLDDRRYYRGIHWPGIHLARWFSTGWSELFHVARWPIPSRARTAYELALRLSTRLVDEDDNELAELRDSFVATHDLRSGAAGGAYPAVWFSRDGDIVTIAWYPPGVEGYVFHNARGQAAVDANEFADAVYGFGEWVLGQLDQSDPSLVDDVSNLKTWLERRWASETARNVLLGFAGIRRDEWPEIAQQVGVRKLEELFQLQPGWDRSGELFRPESCPVAVAFRTASPRLSTADRATIWRVAAKQPRDDRAAAKLESLRQHIAGPVGEIGKDYEQGYSLAEGLRRHLGNTAEFLDIEGFLRDELHVKVGEIALGDPDVEGGSVYSDGHGPFVFVNPAAKASKTQWGRRMTLAHELCHLLFDLPGSSGTHVSGIWSTPGIERRANAFAAELLLPREGIICLLSHALVDLPTDDELSKLMNAFEVGRIAASWHTINRFELLG